MMWPFIGKAEMDRQSAYVSALNRLAAVAPDAETIDACADMVAAGVPAWQMRAITSLLTRGPVSLGGDDHA